MQKRIVALLAGAMLMVATSAMALTVNGTVDVGIADTKIAQTSLANSGDANELKWIKQILGNTVEWEIKTDVNASNWIQTDQTGTWAYDLATAPEYFMIKTGNNSGLIDEHFLFRNNDGLNWAVLDLDASFGSGFELKNIGKVSHLVELNAQTTPVPEPGTILLFSIGILGLTVYGKRRMRKEA